MNEKFTENIEQNARQRAQAAPVSPFSRSSKYLTKNKIFSQLNGAINILDGLG